MPSPPTTLTLLLLSLPLLLLSLFLSYKRRRATRRLEPQPQPQPQPQPDSAAPLFCVSSEPPPPPQEGGGEEMAAAAEVEGEQQRRKKKRGKKKRQEPRTGNGGADGEEKRSRSPDSATAYPFSSFTSATQRKIKLQYDQLVKSNQANALTVDQVGQFINCLVEARNELQHKSEIIQRSFKIRKALLFKADRSSFDRLYQQINKLEAEHKRLEEDAAVYNVLQQQLKLSPAYKTMLEIDARMGMEQKTELDQATEFSDISFEELLAQEKKDSFWQRHNKLRSSAS